MNLILYGSLAMVAYSKPWRAMVCNFLDMTLGYLRSGNSWGLGGVENHLLFSGVVVSNHDWFTVYPSQQIGIYIDLLALIFFRGLKPPTREDMLGNMNTCCFLICRFSQTRNIQPAPGTSKRIFRYGSNWFTVKLAQETFDLGSEDFDPCHFQMGASHWDNLKRSWMDGHG